MKTTANGPCWARPWIRHWKAMLIFSCIGWSLASAAASASGKATPGAPGGGAKPAVSTERYRRLIPYMTYYVAQGLVQGMQHQRPSAPAAPVHNALEPYSPPGRVRGAALSAYLLPAYLVRPGQGPGAAAGQAGSPPRSLFRFDFPPNGRAAPRPSPAPPGPGPGYGPRHKDQPFHPSPPLTPEDGDDDYFKPVTAVPAPAPYRQQHLVVFPEDDTRIRAKLRQQQRKQHQHQLILQSQQQQLQQQQQLLDEGYQLKQQQLLKLIVQQRQVQQAKEIRAQLQAQRLRELLRAQQAQQDDELQLQLRAQAKAHQQAARLREQQERMAEQERRAQHEQQLQRERERESEQREIHYQQPHHDVEQQVIVSLEEAEKTSPTAAASLPPSTPHAVDEPDVQDAPIHNSPVVYAAETETPPTSPHVAPPSSSRELVAHLINGLQSSNKLPQSLTPDNFDMSLKTILQLLKILHKSKAGNGPATTPKRVKVSPDAPERDTSFYIGGSTVSQTFPAPSVEGSTPGRPGVDYPAYDSIPQTSFSCATQRYKGFFGDPETNCQVWHYCDLNGGQASFLCPNGTIFSQVGLTCDWWFNVRCASTAQLYVLNERLYKYILPVKPSFPEDYSGPDVDRYLTEKFREMQAKARGRKEKLKAKDTGGPSNPASALDDTQEPAENNQTEEQDGQSKKTEENFNSKEVDVQQKLDPDL